MTTTQGTALITGASSGIGALYAERLAARGQDVIIVARNRDRLNELASRITDKTGRSVEVLVADLGTREGQRIVEDKLRSDRSITTLVNNAGVGGVMPLLNSDADQMAAMIDLNVTALTRLTYAAVPGFVERGAGQIVNIASIVAIAPEVLNGVYGGTKAFVLAFSQSLHHELASTGIQIQAVLPGAISTEFWGLAGNPSSNLPAEIVMSPDDLVDAALAGLDAKELVTIPSLPNIADWQAYEGARQTLMPNLSRSTPAERYAKAA